MLSVIIPGRCHGVVHIGARRSSGFVLFLDPSPKASPTVLEITMPRFGSATTAAAAVAPAAPAVSPAIVSAGGGNVIWRCIEEPSPARKPAASPLTIYVLCASTAHACVLSRYALKRTAAFLAFCRPYEGPKPPIRFAPTAGSAEILSHCKRVGWDRGRMVGYASIMEANRRSGHHFPALRSNLEATMFSAWIYGHIAWLGGRLAAPCKLERSAAWDVQRSQHNPWMECAKTVRRSLRHEDDIALHETPGQATSGRRAAAPISFGPRFLQ